MEIFVTGSEGIERLFLKELGKPRIKWICNAVLRITR